MNSPAKYIDHTLLRADATRTEIASLCEDAVEFGFASICIPPCYVEMASRQLYGSDVAVCTVVGFPLGSQTTVTKAFEAQHLVGLGAAEVDMVINIGAARAGDMVSVEDDIRQVVAASRPALVKVILECCLFTDPEKKKLAEIAVAAGADYVKTSTGFSQSGATVEDVFLLSQAVAGQAKVKAAGGVRDLETALAMIKAGAERIGTSAGLAIMQQWQREMGQV